MLETSGGRIPSDDRQKQERRVSNGSAWVSVVDVSPTHLVVIHTEWIDQAARHGPSMSVGTDPETWEIIKPYLEKWCAKAPNGEPCVNRMGPGGAGHCKSLSGLIGASVDI